MKILRGQHVWLDDGAYVHSGPPPVGIDVRIVEAMHDADPGGSLNIKYLNGTPGVIASATVARLGQDPVWGAMPIGKATTSAAAGDQVQVTLPPNDETIELVWDMKKQAFYTPYGERVSNLMVGSVLMDASLRQLARFDIEMDSKYMQSDTISPAHRPTKSRPVGKPTKTLEDVRGSSQASNQEG